ncbi:MAG: aryl-sulfate sulfotransferase [Myxococcota bacterium]|nr:aryl-sulfate sulfotransferase [Myxococcota bacterium]
MSRTPNLLFVTLLASACGGGGTQVTGVEAEVSEAIGTIVTVRWTTDTDTVGRVEFGEGEDLNLSTPLETEPTTDHEVVLLGLTAGVQASYRVVVVDGDEEVAGETLTVETGALPNTLPSFTTSGEDAGAYLAVPILGSIAAPVILSPQGEYLWYWQDDRDLDVYRVRLSVDGQSVLYNAASVSGDPSDESVIVRVALDGSEETTISVPLLAHDFVEHADGTIGAMVVEYRDVDGESVRGDQLVEIDPSGEQQVIWSAWDCFDPATTEGEETGWTFANALDYDPDEEAYYLGMRNFSSIVKIDRASGECVWGLGGEAATLSTASGSSTFIHQHQFDLADDGQTIVVFDNDGATGTVSRVLEYALDPEAGEAEETWSYQADPTIYSFVLGDVHRFDDGDTLVTWSTSGQLDRVDPDGELVWQLNSDLGYVFAFNTILDDLYLGE